MKLPALSAGHRHLSDYPTPSLLYGLWGFGSLGGIGLQVQIVTGILLAMHYTPHVVCAGVSIEHILREVYGGWMLRHAHANGASLFFIAVGLHLFRGLAMGHAWPPQIDGMRTNAQYGSNHPLVGANPVDKSAFLTDTIIKDLVGWVLGAIACYALLSPPLWPCVSKTIAALIATSRGTF